MDKSQESFRRRAQALGDPTRHAIFRWLALAARPVPISDLVDEFALNHNTIRQHLAKLRAAELVEETKAPRPAPVGPASSTA